jgi:hypothetical protein
LLAINEVEGDVLSRDGLFLVFGTVDNIIVKGTLIEMCLCTGELDTPVMF